MKRLILFVLFVFAIGLIKAQPFIIKDKNGNDVTSTVIDFAVTNETGETSLGLDVVNNTSTRRSVKVKKIEIALLPSIVQPDYGFMMCWEQCYPPHVYITPDAIRMEPQQLVTNFTGDLRFPIGILGTATAKFVFFDVDSPNDSSYVTINFNIGNVGLNTIPSKLFKVSNAYPNPASSVVYIDYTLPANVSGAKIKVSNLLGTTVTVLDLNKNEGKAGISVSDLKDGVYFYSLMINNSATITRKFVVRR